MHSSAEERLRGVWNVIARNEDAVDPRALDEAIALVRSLGARVNEIGIEAGPLYVPLLTDVCGRRHVRLVMPLIEAMLDVGADPNLVFPPDATREHRTDGVRQTALLAATSRGSTELVEKLLGRGANPNLPGRAKMTALLLATPRSPAIARALLDSGADPLAMSDAGETPLLLATQSADRGEPGGVEILLMIRERSGPGPSRAVSDHAHGERGSRSPHPEGSGGRRRRSGGRAPPTQRRVRALPVGPPIGSTTASARPTLQVESAHFDPHAVGQRGQHGQEDHPG